jgi:protein CpxP
MNNFTNNRWLSVITLLLLTANIVTLALLWTHKPGDRGDKNPPPPPGQVFEFVSHELKLDSTQQEAYKKLRDEHQAAQKPLQDSIRNAKDAFFALLQQGNPPDSLVQSYSKKASDAAQQLEVLTFKHFQKLRALCNAEQQKKFDSIIQDVLRRMAPQKPQGPPPGREGDRPDRDRMPPPDHDGPPPPDHNGPPPPGN